MASPRRLLDVEVLKQGAALLQQFRDAQKRHDMRGADAAQTAWGIWAADYAGDIMEALTAFAALEEILYHTHITEIIWWSDPGTWGLKTDADQTGEEEGEWQDADLATVLREAAAGFVAADEFDEDRGENEVRNGAAGTDPEPKGEQSLIGANSDIALPNDSESLSSPRTKDANDKQGS